jgi:predicted MFS family arabinose efflux permease
MIGTVFLVPAAIHAVQLLFLWRLQNQDANGRSSNEAEAGAGEPVRDPEVRRRAKAFVRLAWVANPFAYVAMYGFVPIFPQLADKFHLNSAQAGVVFSVWQMSRVGAFFLFWRWTGWHYRYRLLLSSFVAMIGCFFAMLLTQSLLPLLVAQVIFGLAIGLIYYSSLYYAMEAGASEGDQGGIHEAAIGFGIGAGPAVGFGALRLMPGSPNAGTWNIGAALMLGLVAFLIVRMRNPVGSKAVDSPLGDQKGA